MGCGVSVGRFKLIVFDWDGTLMDSEARIVGCLAQAFEALGRPVPDNSVLKDIIGLGLSESASVLIPDANDAEIEVFVGHYRRYWLAGSDDDTPLFPGVKALLEDLSQQGYLLAVATGKSRRGLDRSLAASQCGEFFQITRCADETFSKPHPQMLLEIMTDFDVTASETVMIGDTEYDMQMASNAGTAKIAVDYGVHERERLLTHLPLACLGDIRDLPACLSGLV